MPKALLIGIIVAIIFSVLFLAILGILKKKKKQKRHEEDYKRLLPLYSDPNTAKIAIWIDIETINGQPFDESRVYETRVKSEMTGMKMEVSVGLFKPGVYNFTVNSREYSKSKISVELEAGQTYQLGADEEGPYIIVDPQPDRYELKAEY